MEVGAAILVVDDDPGIRALVGGLLGRVGYQVREASDGAAAITAARRERPALVVLDVELPVVSGYEVYREFRDRYGDSLPALFLSGARTEPYDRAAGLMLGADDYVVKPFDPGELLVDGRPYLRSRAVVPYRLDRDPAVVARWRALDRPDRGRVETPEGRVEYLAVPLRSAAGTRGVFVAAMFRDRQKADIEAAVRAAGGVGLLILVLGSLLAWRLARRTVEPVESLTSAARSVSGTDFSRRIPVSGYDEVAQLAETFNDMVDRLEGAFASQRSFVDDAGHELKTPLTIVRGHVELLGDDPAERRQTLRLVLEELDRMQRIVDDLLLLAKREQPDFLHLEAVDVETLTNGLHARVAALAPREWVVESRARGVVVADGHRLTQAIVQLADNAARVTQEGDAIRLGSAIAGEEARFWVSDGGPGIPVADQRRIFERFRRGAGSGRSEGAGLGLAIVKAIAEAHNGRVELASRPGEGATFTLVIPVDQPPAEEDER